MSIKQIIKFISNEFSDVGYVLNMALVSFSVYIFLDRLPGRELPIIISTIIICFFVRNILNK